MKELGWDVDFLYWNDYIYADLKGMEEFFGEDHLFFANATGIEFRHQFRSFIRKYLDRKKFTRYIPVPYDADELYSSDIQKKAISLHERYHYDAVWLEYYLQSKLFEALDDTVVKVIHTHDRFTNRNRMFQRERKVPEFYYLTEKGERKALSRADVVIAVQERERQIFEKLTKGTNTVCLAVGNFIEEQDNEIVYGKNYGFIGSINDANIDAAKLFISQYLPAVKEKEPDSQFIIAGGVCKEIPDSSQYIKMGYINRLEDFYDKVSFIVTPMLAGTGLNIKNIEALSYGKPVVTTPIGAKGLKGAEKALKIANKGSGYIDCVVGLLRNQEEISRMSMEAKEFVKTYNAQNVENYKYIEKMARERN